MWYKRIAADSGTSGLRLSPGGHACHSERSEESWLDLNRRTVTENNANSALLSTLCLLLSGFSLRGHPAAIPPCLGMTPKKKRQRAACGVRRIWVWGFPAT